MNQVKNSLKYFLPVFLFSIQAFSQTADSTALNQRKSGFRIAPDSVKTPSEITMPMFRMAHKGLVSREMVSARFEFNAFGIPIEMSDLNRKNRMFAYRSLVDKTKMKYFINAKHYEATQDSSVLKNDNLKAVRQDSTLLKDLNSKVFPP